MSRFDKPAPKLSDHLWALMFGMLILFIVLFYFELAHAEKKITDIGVRLSTTCIIMLQNNFTTNCPTYEEIILIYGDTSNKRISGGFVYDEYGFLYREPPNYQNHFDAYSYEGFVLWVDPPGDIVGRIPTITIESNIPQYKIPTISNKMINNTQIVGEYLWLDDKCRNASISADRWLDYFSPTYSFMYNNCPEEDRPDPTKKIIHNATYQDITTTYKYKLDKWVAESKIKCLIVCKEY